MRLWHLQALTVALIALMVWAVSSLPRVTAPSAVRSMCAQPLDAIERSACAQVGL